MTIIRYVAHGVSLGPFKMKLRQIFHFMPKDCIYHKKASGCFRINKTIFLFAVAIRPPTYCWWLLPTYEEGVGNARVMTGAHPTLLMQVSAWSGASGRTRSQEVAQNGNVSGGGGGAGGGGCGGGGVEGGGEWGGGGGGWRGGRGGVEGWELHRCIILWSGVMGDMSCR